ncbi:MFS transporter [Saccharomonospora sp. NPDC046836]|uniref:MFS transporter n=1 Tax=Saccharomonospora sp. NPDC046836 TaxID=3156921 RepID=UPI0033F21EB1
MSERTAAPATERAQSQRRSLLVSGLGNVLEWYEWTVYAVFAPFIAVVVFNAEDEVSALLSTLGVYAVGFLMRPVGGIVFGRIADRRGRKFALLVTMTLMAVCSLAIGLIPTYATVGALASLLLVLLRLLQGFAHGGESTVVGVYIAEIATPKRRALWSSLTFVAIFGGAVVAYLVGAAVTTIYDDATVVDWAWRIPFIVGGLAALAVVGLRSQMSEPEVYADAATAMTKAPRASLGERLRVIGLIFALMAGVTAAHYTWQSYASTYAITQKGMDASAAFWMSLVATSIAMMTVPLFGVLADRVGRRPMLLFFAIAAFVLQFPLMQLISDRPWTLLVASTVGLLLVSTACSISAAMSEIVPTHVRAQVLGIGYSLSVALFGGTAPYLNQMFNSEGIPWAASVYIMVLAVITGVAALRIPETRNADLNQPSADGPRIH